MEFRSCTQPWFEMQLRYNSSHGFCCFHYDLPFDNKALDVTQLWNGPIFQKTRGEILTNEPKGTRCEGCPFITYYDQPIFLTIPEHITGARRDNWQRAIEHYHRGDTVLESLPIKYFLFFGLACNLRCVMCDHPIRFNAGENAFFDPTALLSRPEYMAQASKIDVIGGEPFLIPQAVKFIDTLCASNDTKGMEVAVYTNGVLLDRFIERMSALDHLIMVVSLDSHGKHYEKIRLRAQWDRIERNMRAFLAHGKKLGKPWTTSIAVTVMKDGLLGYPDLVRYAIDIGQPIHFAPVASHTPDARKQNIFSHPKQLEEVPGWEKAMEEAVSLLKQDNRMAAAGQLNQMYEEFVRKVHEPEKEKSNQEKELQKLASINSWSPVFQGQEVALVQGLEMNVYNGSADQALRRNGAHIGFYPTNPRDHLASPFRQVKNEGNLSPDNYVRLAILWPPDASPENFCTIEMQDQAFNPITPHIVIDRNKGREKLMFYRLQDNQSRVRLIFLPSSNQYGALPRAVMMDAHHGMVGQA
jgi:MoaA/NifB/PqqE/SkfB family radical SAM enzyme